MRTGCPPRPLRTVWCGVVCVCVWCVVCVVGLSGKVGAAGAQAALCNELCVSGVRCGPRCLGIDRLTYHAGEQLDDADADLRARGVAAESLVEGLEGASDPEDAEDDDGDAPGARGTKLGGDGLAHGRLVGLESRLDHTRSKRLAKRVKRRRTAGPCMQGAPLALLLSSHPPFV